MLELEFPILYWYIHYIHGYNYYTILNYIGNYYYYITVLMENNVTQTMILFHLIIAVIVIYF